MNDDAFTNDTASNNSANPASQDILHRGVEGIALIDAAPGRPIDSDYFEDEAV